MASLQSLPSSFACTAADAAAQQSALIKKRWQKRKMFDFDSIQYVDFWTLIFSLAYSFSLDFGRSRNICSRLGKIVLFWKGRERGKKGWVGRKYLRPIAQKTKTEVVWCFRKGRQKIMYTHRKWSEWNEWKGKKRGRKKRGLFGEWVKRKLVVYLYENASWLPENNT
jgi:hypothetical protein